MGRLVLFGQGSEAGKGSQRQWVYGRPRGDRQVGRAPVVGKDASTQSDAPFALAPSRTKARIPFEGLEVRVAARDGVFEIMQRDVLAPAGEGLAHVTPPRIRNAIRMFQAPPHARATAEPA